MFKLLPQKYKDILKKEYGTRMWALLIFGLSCGLLAWFLILLPGAVSYFFQGQAISNGVLEIDKLKKDPGHEEQKAMSGGRDFEKKVLDLSLDNQTISTLISNIERQKSVDVFINTYEIYNKEKRLVVRGIAKDRNTIINFADILRQNPVFKSVDLPISSLAENTNNSFSLNIVYGDK